ncbi:MAG: ABC transporter substrate-binding protein [Chloroflexota bacterium]
MIIQQPTVQLADPHICSDARSRLNILTAIFDALVQRNSAGQFVPGLAANWSVEEGAKKWTFNVRDGVSFHNGDSLRAEDVVESLRRACDPSVGGELGTEGVWASYLGEAEIAAVNGQTVTIATAQPMADLLDLLVAIPILPQRALPDLPSAFVGSGPWRLVEWSAEQVLLEAFSAAQVRQPQTPFATTRLHWQAEPNEEARIEALLAGKTDIITDLSPQNAPKIAQGAKHVLSQPSNLCVAFLCNASRGPCTNVYFRQALNHAINVQRMVTEAIHGGGTRLNGPLSPFHFGCDRDVLPYAFDQEKARSLLAASGMDKKVVVDLPMTLPDEAPLLGEMLAEDLALVGVEVELRHFSDRSAYAHRVKEKQIDDLCCFDSSPLSTYRVLREKINSDVAGPWWQGYSNSGVNGLLDKASQTVDKQERQSIYRQAYRIVHEEAPWLFLYHPTNYWGVNWDEATGPSPDKIGRTSEGLLQFVSH